MVGCFLWRLIYINSEKVWMNVLTSMFSTWGRKKDFLERIITNNICSTLKSYFKKKIKLVKYLDHLEHYPENIWNIWIMFWYISEQWVNVQFCSLELTAGPRGQWNIFYKIIFPENSPTPSSNSLTHTDGCMVARLWPKNGPKHEAEQSW